MQCSRMDIGFGGRVLLEVSGHVHLRVQQVRVHHVRGALGRAGLQRVQNPPVAQNRVVDAALDAGDAIDAALTAPTKELTVHYWQKVFGPSFQG